MLDMGEVLYRTEYRRTLTLETGNSEEPRTCVEADQVVYATLTGVDVMLLRLTETYEQIERRAGVKPLIVSDDTAFPAGLTVRMPSGLWQNDRACEVELTVEKVKESRWIVDAKHSVFVSMHGLRRDLLHILCDDSDIVLSLVRTGVPEE
jgi:hypothetical protein